MAIFDTSHPLAHDSVLRSLGGCVKWRRVWLVCANLQDIKCPKIQHRPMISPKVYHIILLFLISISIMLPSMAYLYEGKTVLGVFNLFFNILSLYIHLTTPIEKARKLAFVPLILCFFLTFLEINFGNNGSTVFFGILSMLLTLVVALGPFMNDKTKKALKDWLKDVFEDESAQLIESNSTPNNLNHV